VVLLVLNLAGTALYFWAVSSFGAWPIDDEPTTAEPFIWGMIVIPIFAVALLVNVPWGAIILWRRQWNSARLWTVVAAIWLLAVEIDYAHH